MALTKAAWKQRVEAACALYGYDLGYVDRLKLEGLPKGAARRAGHDSDTYAPNHALALSLAEHFALPIEWFEDENWEGLIRAPTEDSALPALRAELLAEFSQVQTELEALRSLLERVQRGLEGPRR